MPTLTLDAIDESGIEQEGLILRYRRAGFIDDLDVSDPARVLERSLNFLIQQGYGMSSYKDAPGGTLIRRIFIKPWRDNAVKLVLCYESPEYGVTSAYFIRTKAYQTSFTTTYLPGTNRGVLIRTDYRRPGFPFSTGDGTVNQVTEVSIPADNIPMTFFRAMLSVSVNAVIYGSPPENLENAINKVNAEEWRGKKKGFWIVTDIESDQSKYGGYYTYSASVLTKVDEPWDELGLLRNHMTGKFPDFDQAKITALLQKDYVYGVDAPPGEGIVRVGPYQMTKFKDLFKFDGLG
jgi:hypothetical protein